MAQARSGQPSRDRPSRSAAAAEQPSRPSRAADRHSRGRIPATELRLRRGFLWWGRNAFALAVIALVWQVLLIARGVVSGLLSIVLLTVFAAVVALLCGPATSLLRRQARLPSTLAALLTLIVLVAVIAGIIWLVAPPLVTEGRRLGAELPGFQDRLNALSTVLRNAGINVGTLSLKGVVNSLLGSGAGVGGVLVGAVTSTLSVIVDIVVVVVAAFWFLRDGDLLRHLVIDSLPAAWRPHLYFGLRAFAVVIGGYVRGQVVMAVMVGTMVGLGSLLIGVPFPLVVAVAAGFFELIPLVGPFVGGRWRACWRCR